MSPGGGQRAAKARQRCVLFDLVGRGDTRRFNSLDQLERAGRTANGRGDERGIPDLEADLYGTNQGKRRNEQPKDGDSHGPTKLSDTREAGVRRFCLHVLLVHR